MPIEFICPTCQQQLRVPDDAVGKNAKCPKCNGMAIVPAGSAPAAGTSSPFAGAPSPFAGAPSPFAGGSAPFPTGPFPTAAKPPDQPAWAFGDAGQGAGGNPFSPHSSGANPYASPQPLTFQLSAPMVGGVIRNQQVGVDPIFNYAWQVWQQNLGILVGTTVTLLGINYALAFAIGIAQGAMEQNGAPEAAAGLALVGQIVANAIQIFLTIGQVQIALKLARGQRAEYSELFNGGSRFWPVLGVSILMGLAIGVGLLLLIVPGIILALMWWPAYYLVLDGKADVMDSFAVASRITEGNKGTAFLLWLLSIVIMFVGLIALCIGIIFAAPLVTMMWTIAYLMMSGQLAPYAPAGQMQPAPQHWPSKP